VADIGVKFFNEWSKDDERAGGGEYREYDSGHPEKEEDEKRDTDGIETFHKISCMDSRLHAKGGQAAGMTIKWHPLY
jgi:hypothetical protein